MKRSQPMQDIAGEVFNVEDHYRRIFDRYDQEGFGEIGQEQFQDLLRDSEFVNRLNRELLYVDLEGTMRKLRILGQEHSEIRFDDFIAAITRKRRLSFKCAVHFRDRQVHLDDQDQNLNQEDEEDSLTKEMSLRKRAKLRLFQVLLPRTWSHPFVIYQTDLHWPMVLLLLTLVQVGVFWHYSASIDCFLVDWLDFNPNQKSGFWRFYTYCLGHRRLEDVVMTVLVHLVIGIPLEVVFGSVRIFLLYLLGVLGGSLLCTGLDPDVPLAGASGGRICLVTSLLVTWLVTPELKDTKPKAKWVKIVFLIAVISSDFGLSVYKRYLLNDPLSYCGHVSGLLFGVVTGGTVMRKFDQVWKSDRSIWCHYLLLIALMVFALFSQSIFKRNIVTFQKTLVHLDDR